MGLVLLSVGLGGIRILLIPILVPNDSWFKFFDDQGQKMLRAYFTEKIKIKKTFFFLESLLQVDAYLNIFTFTTALTDFKER